MPLHILNENLWFPPIEDALEDGLLAMGGDLSTQRLLLAYKSGIFPWYEENVPLWWSPSPRFVLFPEKLKISHSMKQLLHKDYFQFKQNQNFKGVIDNCKSIERRGQDGTWITPEMKAAYVNLHEKGYAISGETYLNNELVGGLYGIKLGNIFFGESMFAKESNASKYAFINMVQWLQSEGVQLIDCQVYTPHLESLGAEMISRQLFKYYLRTEI
ncbi:leucyl/phenylalanyl-tRNA--protein transferase [Rhizosphaericola mali]|uniref:Leucyl/phenylalanyl-tRNA--protein transferase n=1 Tax=Rhizosphaericola mali TaxID=2545455 RepID=A0A5P2FXM0_9BACT|nr:leucyl/phenylalanyl-tRNA--protein transferase [Rhizosphaericola mali]QES88226.1 leucyl/phenylalanyl-tRNA--protein transferase [Rhizosphaericola mali]